MRREETCLREKERCRHRKRKQADEITPDSLKQIVNLTLSARWPGHHAGKIWHPLPPLIPKTATDQKARHPQNTPA